MEQETSPYIKQHDENTICFADTLVQARNALEGKNLPKDAPDLTNAHLMLFGVEEWKKADMNGLKGALKSSSNKFNRIEVFGCDMKAADQLAFGDLLDPQHLENVKQFDLDNTKLEPKGAKAIFSKIVEVPSIEVLNLQGSIEGKADVMAAIAEGLAENGNIYKSLYKIDLKINELKQDSAVHVASIMKRMQQTGGEHNSCEVDLFYNDVQAEGAIHIATALQSSQCAITHLDLCCNNIGDKGALAIADMLRVNRSLKVLKLALNNIGNVGGIAICKAIAPRQHDTNQVKNKVLEVLDLSANVMKEDKMAEDTKGEDTEAKKKIADLQDQLEKLRDENGFTLDGKEAEVEKLEQELDKVQLKHVEQMPMVEALAHVCTTSYLREFDFTGVEFGNAMWAALGHHLSITTNKTLQMRGEPMKIRFSIVDLMNEENLKTMEKYIWGKKENLSSPYHTHRHIEWRRRDDEEKKN